MNEDPKHLPDSKPHWPYSILLLQPICYRVFFSVSAWLFAFILTAVGHLCGLGYKTAERVAPFVVATLAALSIACIRRYRLGVPVAIAIVGVYEFAIYPAYSYWIHGPGRHHFPGAVPELSDLDETTPSARDESHRDR